MTAPRVVAGRAAVEVAQVCAACFDRGVDRIPGLGIEALLDRLVDDGLALADAAARAWLGGPVPRTDWLVRDLVAHVGGVHRWAADVVRTGVSDLDTAAGRLVGRGLPDDELVEWYAAGHRELVKALRAARPDMVAGTFLPAQSPLHFWTRRQAHETAVHRADADAASADRAEFDADFAQDGIAEFLQGFALRPSLAMGGSWTLRLQASDGAAWWVTLGSDPARAANAESSDHADLVVSGRSSDLYLWLWNRDCAVELEGQEDLAVTWAETVRVRWT